MVASRIARSVAHWREGSLVQVWATLLPSFLPTNLPTYLQPTIHLPTCQPANLPTHPFFYCTLLYVCLKACFNPLAITPPL